MERGDNLAHRGNPGSRPDRIILILLPRGYREVVPIIRHGQSDKTMKMLIRDMVDAGFLSRRWAKLLDTTKNWKWQ